MGLSDRILVEIARGRVRPVDPADIYFLEAENEATRLRLHSARTLLSYRSLGELEPVFAPHGFLRVHRNHVVNLRRIHVIRRRKKGDDWEVRLDPPVNRVLPVSRSRLSALWAAFTT